MSKGLLYVLLIGMAILNLFLVYKVNTFKKNPSISGTPTEEKTRNKDQSSYITSLRGKILLQTEYHPIQLDRNAILTDTLGNAIPLNRIIRDKGALVFFFTDRHCYSCIDGAIPKLDSIAQKIGSEHILVLAQLEDQRDIISYKARYKSRLSFYYVDNSVVATDAKNINHPFLFMVNSNGRPDNPFFIESSLPEVTDDYLKRVEMHFGSTGL